MNFVFNDGGRAKAGFKGFTRDCTVRAISTATEQSYDVVYDSLNNLIKTAKQTKKVKGKSARTGTPLKLIHKYMDSIGWEWIACMTIGSGCKVHLKESELPKGRIVCRVSKHLTCVIDGVLHDTWDCSKNETKCVYGYWIKK